MPFVRGSRRDWTASELHPVEDPGICKFLPLAADDSSIFPRPPSAMARERLMFVGLLRHAMRWRLDRPLRDLIELLVVGSLRMSPDAAFVNPSRCC